MMRTGLGALCIALAAGCTAIPRATNELESARAAYRAAAASPQVQARAAVELEMAERALADAERFQQADADPGMVAHFAYLAEQRARIAMKTAEMRNAEAALATSSEERSRMQAELAARERQRAEAQRREAELAADQAAAQKRIADERAAQLSNEISRLQSQMSELKARETDRGWVLTLRNDVLFDSGSAKLKPGAEKAVEQLAQLMQKEPERGIAIEGFTDSTGSAQANRRLSEARAAAVKQALIARGIEPKRIEARGYGPAYPVASNATPVGRQLNRRVEVVLAPQSPSSSGGGTR